MNRTQEASNQPLPTEDILASIRQILNEDLVPISSRSKASVVSLKKRSVKKQSVVKDEAVQESDLLELTAEMLCDPPQKTEDILPLKTPVAEVSDPCDALIAPEVLQETAQAFAQLKGLQESLLAGNTPPVLGNKSLDQYTQEIMRPLLKQWLDAHLPAVVKKLVAEEIAKVTRHQSKAA
ncbi:MAG: DUF2497 domain-containing protein [Pseudomonadota bacterium]